MDDHQFKQEEMVRLENCVQFAHKLFWNVCIWHVLGDLTYYGLWTNLLVRSRNGQKLVRNVWRAWSRTFITHVNTGNIVLWETLHSNAGWHCCRIQTLLETWKIRSQHQEEFFSEVTRSCQQVGCARNRLLFHTVLQKFRWSISRRMFTLGWVKFDTLIPNINSQTFYQR